MKTWIWIIICVLCLFIGMVTYAGLDDYLDADLNYAYLSTGVAQGCTYYDGRNADFSCYADTMIKLDSAFT